MSPPVPLNAIHLRAIQAADLPLFFEFQRDPVACRTAAFTAADPDDRAGFEAHWTRILADPAVVNRSIVVGDAASGRVIGHVAAFDQFGQREITYWIARADWGRGFATRALSLFLAQHRERPLHARAASDNAGSIRVLLKCGFVAVGHERGFASARRAEIDETVFRLGDRAARAPTASMG